MSIKWVVRIRGFVVALGCNLVKWNVETRIIWTTSFRSFWLEPEMTPMSWVSGPTWKTGSQVPPPPRPSKLCHSTVSLKALHSEKCRGGGKITPLPRPFTDTKWWIANTRTTEVTGHTSMWQKTTIPLELLFSLDGRAHNSRSLHTQFIEAQQTRALEPRRDNMPPGKSPAQEKSKYAAGSNKQQMNTTCSKFATHQTQHFEEPSTSGNNKTLCLDSAQSSIFTKIGGCPTASRNFWKSWGLMPVDAAFVMGWKYTRSCPPLTNASSQMNFTSLFLSFMRAYAVTHPCFTPSFSKRTSSSAKRKPPGAFTFFDSSFSLTSRSWRAEKSHSPFFFLSFMKRFLQCTPGKCFTCGIISSTVNTFNNNVTLITGQGAPRWHWNEARTKCNPQRDRRNLTQLHTTSETLLKGAEALKSEQPKAKQFLGDLRSLVRFVSFWKKRAKLEWVKSNHL